MARPTLYVARTADIGPALKDLRRSEGVSQADVAEATGIHQSHIGTYERNTVCPNARRLLDFMQAHDYVLGFVPKELAKRPEERFPVTDWIKTPCDTNACVEVGRLDHGDVAIRNSNFKANTVVFTKAEMAAFIRAVKLGDFDELMGKP